MLDPTFNNEITGDTEAVFSELNSLKIKNNIIDILLKRLEGKNIDDFTDLMNLIDEYVSNDYSDECDDRDEIIKCLNYYLKISNPNQNCYLLISNIIDNLNGNLHYDGIECDFEDFNNNYMTFLYLILVAI